MNKTKLLAILKKEAKRRHVAATIKDGDCYLAGSYIALKMPAAFWPEYLQPFFMRQLPADGETVHFGDERAHPLDTVSNILAFETQPLDRTSVIWEMPLGGKLKQAHLYLYGDAPVLLNEDYLTVVDVDTPARGSGSLRPVVFEFLSGSISYITTPLPAAGIHKEAVHAVAKTLSQFAEVTE